MEQGTDVSPCVDLLSIASFATLAEAEAMIFNRIQAIVGTLELGFAEVGILGCYVESSGIWKERVDPATGQPCTSANQWLMLAAGRSRSSCFDATAKVKVLLAENISAEDIAQIPASNFKPLMKCSSAVRKDPEVLKAARTDKLVEHVQTAHPTQALEPEKVFRVTLDASAHAKVEATMQKVMEMEGWSRSEALEGIMADVREEWHG
jgi:hypothetical protein